MSAGSWSARAPRSVRQDLEMSEEQATGRAPRFRRACVPMGDHERCFRTVAGRSDLPCMCPCHEERNEDGSDQREPPVSKGGSPTLIAIALDGRLSAEHRKSLAKVYRGLVALEA
jgi:hypothetical protein